MRKQFPITFVFIFLNLSFGGIGFAQTTPTLDSPEETQLAPPAPVKQKLKSAESNDFVVPSARIAELSSDLSDNDFRPLTNLQQSLHQATYSPDDPQHRGAVYRSNVGHAGKYYGCDCEECQRFSPFIYWQSRPSRILPPRAGVLNQIRCDLAEVRQRIKDGAGACRTCRDSVASAPCSCNQDTPVETSPTVVAKNGKRISVREKLAQAIQTFPKPQLPPTLASGRLATIVSRPAVISRPAVATSSQRVSNSISLGHGHQYGLLSLSERFDATTNLNEDFGHDSVAAEQIRSCFPAEPATPPKPESELATNKDIMSALPKPPTEETAQPSKSNEKSSAPKNSTPAKQTAKNQIVETPAKSTAIASEPSTLDLIAGRVDVKTRPARPRRGLLYTWGALKSKPVDQQVVVRQREAASTPTTSSQFEVQQASAARDSSTPPDPSIVR